MIVHLIIACEIMFWVFIAAGLAARYLLRRKTLGAALLICAPLVDVVLLVATALDLRGGGEANFTHGLAAAYIGFSVAFGHSLISWADARFAYRFAGGPAPVAPPEYGVREHCANGASSAKPRSPGPSRADFSARPSSSSTTPHVRVPSTDGSAS